MQQKLIGEKAEVQGNWKQIVDTFWDKHIIITQLTIISLLL